MYNDIIDNTGTVVRTAAEVQGAVGGLLRQLGISGVFADGIAAEYAAPGKAGNDLHARLATEIASISSPPAAPGPKPSQAMMDAAAELVDDEAFLFSLRDLGNDSGCQSAIRGRLMKRISDELVQELRRSASRGANVPDLLRLLHKRLGDEAAYGSTVAKYLMAAFGLPLRAVSAVGGWTPGSESEMSDARIQELIHPEIMRTKAIWYCSDSATEPQPHGKNGSAHKSGKQGKQ